MLFEIQKVNVKFMGNVKFIKIEINNFIIGDTPQNLKVTLYDEFGREAYNTLVALDSADYNQWGLDDKFIAECVCRTLELTLV